MTEEKTKDQNIKLALFPGCSMPTEQYGYELSVREVMPLVGVELVDLEGWSCCGEPMKSVNALMTLYLSARNIALAEKAGLDILAPCAMCHLALSDCMHVLGSDESLKKRINEKLASEDLEYHGSAKLYHVVDLLYDVVGLEKIQGLVKKPLKDLSVATHYGCHLLRPSVIGRPVDSEQPKKMEEIIKICGGSAPFYPEKLDCCGGIVQFNLLESALTKTGQKLKAVKDAEFSCFVDVCPWCHKMFDARQQKAAETVAAKLDVPVLYFTQLLGLALGIDSKKLGLFLNQSPMQKFEEAF